MKALISYSRVFREGCPLALVCRPSFRFCQDHIFNFKSWRKRYAHQPVIVTRREIERPFIAKQAESVIHDAARQ